MKNRFLKILLTVIITVTTILPAQLVSADTSRYLAAVLYDYASFKMQYSIILENETTPYRLASYSGGDGATNRNYKGWEVATTDKTLRESSNTSTGVTWLLFPGSPIGFEGTPSQIDYNQADDVVGTLVNNLNTAIAFCVANGDGSIVNSKLTVDKVATTISQKPDKAYGVTFNWGSGADAKEIEGAKGTFKQGITANDYVTLTSDSNKEKITLIWKCPKGYAENQFLSGSGVGDTTHSHLTWGYLTYFANQALATGLSADNDGWKEFQDIGTFEKMISEFAQGIINTSSSAIGMSNLEDMVFARNERASSYYLGIMPVSWWKTANTLYWVFEIIGVFILFASILYLIYKQNHAVLSPRDRLAIQDHIADLLMAIFLMAAYPLIFYILGKTNSMIVSLFNSFSGGKTLQSAASYKWWIALVMAIVEIVIVVKLNVEYLTRAVTVTALHVIAPAAIASMSIQGRQRGIFNTWIKEMVGAIFIQSFDAIVLALFILVLGNSASSTPIESILMMFMFVPLNKWFKASFLQTTSVSGIAGDTTSSAVSAAKTTANVVGGAIGGAKSIANKGFSAAEAYNRIRGIGEGDKNSDSSQGKPFSIPGTLSGGNDNSGGGGSSGGASSENKESGGESSSNIVKGGSNGNVSGQMKKSSVISSEGGSSNGTITSDEKKDERTPEQKQKEAKQEEARARDKANRHYAGMAVAGEILGIKGMSQYAQTKANNIAHSSSSYDSNGNVMKKTGKASDTIYRWYDDDRANGKKKEEKKEEKKEDPFQVSPSTTVKKIENPYPNSEEDDGLAGMEMEDFTDNEQ